MKASPITTHVLDTARGRPAAGMPLVLQGQIDGSWQELAEGVTGSDGRVSDLLPPDRVLEPGLYRLIFDTAAYFEAAGMRGFYPEVDVTFEVRPGAQQHYHVPLLLSPHGYSTYRGS